MIEMKPLAWVLAGSILCAGAVTTPAQTHDEKANAFFEKAFDEYVDRSPMLQDQLGIHHNADKWDDISDAYAEETLRLLQRHLSHLERTVARDKLGAGSRLSYDLFIDDVRARMDALRWRTHAYPVNQMYGLQSTVPSHLISYHAITSTDDARRYIRRLERVPDLFEELIRQLQRLAERGVIPPKFVFAHAISDARNVISGAPFDDGELCAIIADFRKKVMALDIDDEAKVELGARAANALIRHVGPAYTQLIGYLEQLERQAGTDDGVWRLPDGSVYYAYRLKAMTTTDLTAEEIHHLGLREVDRIHDEMRAIMEKTSFEGTLQDFFVFVRSDPRFYFPESDEGRDAYLAEATRIIDRMRERLPEVFATLPEAQIEVRPVEAFREKSAGKAFYQRPAPDGSRPGVYYANLYQMKDMPTYQMEALAYHEGIPGHHMQLAIAQELDDIPRFRRYARYTAYTEGWGLYSEFLPREMGLYEDSYSDFGRLAMELWRACRLVVDTGIHDRKWTREEAIAFLAENTPNPENDCVKAIERYIVMPGQATAYKIGMIRILQLRERARAELGERFDIRAFHDVVLRNGPVPLNVLEKLVDEWISTRRRSSEAG